MKIKEIRSMKPEEVDKQISTLRKDLSEQMLTYRTKETKNVRSIRALKKDLARLLTIRSEAKEQEATNV